MPLGGKVVVSKTDATGGRIRGFVGLTQVLAIPNSNRGRYYWQKKPDVLEAKIKSWSQRLFVQYWLSIPATGQRVAFH